MGELGGGVGRWYGNGSIKRHHGIDTLQRDTWEQMRGIDIYYIYGYDKR